ncbi:Protein CASPARIAN STRIP INTEGRITY FACTOR 1, partial [Mucuna pruriens]
IGNTSSFCELKRRKISSCTKSSWVLSCFSTSSAFSFSSFLDHFYQLLLQGTPRKPLDNEEVRTIHERLLRANTKDYGRYDPSPSLSKPPFKLIPN